MPWPAFAPWWRALVCLVLGSLCLPAGTTTLVRCQINHKIVYSDSDCPADASRRSGFAGMPTSRPITIRFPRNKAGSVSTRKKAGPH